MRKKVVKSSVIILGTMIAIILLVIGVAFLILFNRTNHILEDYSSIYSNEKYGTSVIIENVNVIEQDISCGYAVIEMFSTWDGKDITEESLYEEYKKVVTSTGKSFCEEMNKRFPSYNTVMYKYLTNTELIDKVYDSLSNGVPVPFEWAAKYNDEWTLHYSLITGLDITNDKVVIANPYGYYEEISVTEFLDRTSFEAYSDMPFYFRLAFAFGVFEKNTIFIVEQ